MNTVVAVDTTVVQKTRRLLRIGRRALREYRAFRTFTALSDDGQAHRQDIPRRFAQSLLELGPLFIKAGQILSTRPDVLPAAYIAALARLQEHVPPSPFDQIRAIIEEQFDGDIGDLYRSFEKTPIASASLAQVHFAVLNDGTPVAVKVQRPFVRDRMTADLDLFGGLIGLGHRFFPGTVRRLNVRAGFNEFRRYTLQELDYTIEATTTERFAHHFSDWPDIIIPRVYRDRVSPTVLTMGRVLGRRLNDITPTLSVAERTRLSHRLLEMEMKMFIADGVFHADLHPGNIFFTDDGKIALLDFGMYGELSEEHRDHFMLYWYAGLQRQTRRAFYHLVKQTTRIKGADEDAYYTAFKDLADRFYGSTIAERSLTQTYLAIILSGARFGFVFPSDLLLQAKALTTAEALAFGLTPDLRFEDEMRPIIARAFVRRVADVGRLKAQAERVLPELLLFGELPPTFAREHTTSDVPLPFDWGDALAVLGAQVSALRPNMAVLRSVLDPHAHAVLTRAYSAHDVDDILNKTWTRYAADASSLPSEETIGARITVQLAALTIALYHVLLAAGQSPEDATTLIYDVSWLVYTKMGAIPWALAGSVSDDGYDKLRSATAAFRQFPFSAPSYGWKDIDAAPGVVAFDCLKCPVAEHFRAQNLADLCVNTWCKLDYPLARQWDSELTRTGTIASGAPVCDFRWHAGARISDTPVQVIVEEARVCPVVALGTEDTPGAADDATWTIRAARRWRPRAVIGGAERTHLTPPSSETPHSLRHGRVASCNRTLLSAPCLRASVPMPIMPQRRHCRIRGASRARLVRNEPHERLDDHKQ